MQLLQNKSNLLSASHNAPTDDRNCPVTMLRPMARALQPTEPSDEIDNSTALDIHRRRRPTDAPTGRLSAGLPHCPLHTAQQESNQ